MSKKVVTTRASGFIGGYVVEADTKLEEMLDRVTPWIENAVADGPL